jgi:hypothetical protein
MKEGEEKTIISWRSALRGLWKLAELNQKYWAGWNKPRREILKDFDYQDKKYIKEKLKQAVEFIKFIIRKM